MKYKKKPVIIDAWKYDGTIEFIRFMEVLGCETSWLATDRETVLCWKIKTLKGEHVVSLNDYIIRGVKGEFYPCKPDIFKLTYDEVTE